MYLLTQSSIAINFLKLEKKTNSSKFDYGYGHNYEHDFFTGKVICI